MADEAEWKEPGRCVVCGVAGQGEKDYICELCGDRNKLLLVCRCGRRIDLTDMIGTGVLKGLGAIIAWDEAEECRLRPGMTISVAECLDCSGEAALNKEAIQNLKIYSLK